jgi:hypothetical protein
MTGEAGKQSDGLGIWIRFWDLAIAFALMISAFLLVRLEAIPQLRAVAAEKTYFTGKPLLLDTYRRGYSFETVRDHLRALGDGGREFYANSFIPIYDVALSLFLMTFLILFVLYATQSNRYHAIGLPGWTRIVLLIVPVVQFLCDVGENVLLRSVIDSFPWIDAELVQRASFCTRLKWIAIFLNSMIFMGLGGYTLYQWLASPDRTAPAGRG